MGRKLPWAPDGSPHPRKPHVDSAVTNTPASSMPKADPGRRETKHVTPEPTPTPRLRRKRATSRSPSSSPIRRAPQSIPLIEPMKSHPHRSDDRYIMVEDEFEAIAKSFTAHLHAAEYDRLRRKAKEQPPQVKLSPTSNMPATVKQSLARRELQEKQGRAFEQVMGHVNGEDRDADATMSDPWSGTSLAGLMGESESAKRSLVGLERLNSSTRAARGFGRGRSGMENDGKGLTEKATADDSNTLVNGDNNNGSDDDQAAEDSSNKSRQRKVRNARFEDSHEQNPASKRRPPRSDAISSLDTEPTISRSRLDTHYPRHHDPEPTSPARVRKKPTTHDLGRPRIRARSYVDDLDDFNESKFYDGSSSPTAKSPASKSTPPPSKRFQQAKREKDRKSRLDEVPSFW